MCPVNASTGDTKTQQQAAPTPSRRPEEHLGDFRGVSEVGKSRKWRSLVMWDQGT